MIKKENSVQTAAHVYFLVLISQVTEHGACSVSGRILSIIILALTLPTTLLGPLLGTEELKKKLPKVTKPTNGSNRI